MKLYEKLPDSVTVNGKRIRLDLDFRNVLRFIDILCEENLTSEAREYLALKCICKHPKKGMMIPIRKLLFPGATAENAEKITDFSQDADLIRAAFLQEYGINLFREKLHWFEFSCLFGCLPSGSRYSDILQIRAKPIPAPTNWNAEERAWLIKAKSEYAIQTTEKGREKKYEHDVQSIGQMLDTLFGDGE